MRSNSDLNAADDECAYGGSYNCKASGFRNIDHGQPQTMFHCSGATLGAMKADGPRVAKAF